MGQVFNPLVSEGQGNLLTFFPSLLLIDTLWPINAYMFSAASLYKPVLCSIRITEICVAYDRIH